MSSAQSFDTKGCVYGWSILQIPQDSDKQEFIKQGKKIVCPFTPREE